MWCGTRDTWHLTLSDTTIFHNTYLLINIFFFFFLISSYSNYLKKKFIFRAAQQAAAALAAQTGVGGTRKGPPPLLRSRTLPAIIVPGISILNAQIDPSRLTPGNLCFIKSFFFFYIKSIKYTATYFIFMGQ